LEILIRVACPRNSHYVQSVNNLSLTARQ